MTLLDKEVNYLKGSVLYNLSLSSIELFHSNFLYWLASKYQKEVGSMFLDFFDIHNENTSIELPQREDKNIDLTLTYSNGNVIVIENKVKSLPYQEQLERYSQKFDENTKFILLSLSEPLFFNGKKEFNDNNNCKWKYLSYSEYSELLSKIPDKISDNYDKLILEDYIHFIKQLAIINSKIDLGNEILSERDSILVEKLKKIRFDSFYKKKKYNLLLHNFKEKLEESNFRIKIYKKKLKDNLFDDNVIYLKSGFSNDNAFMEFKLKINEDIMIGTQIQGLQYRQYVHSNGNTTKIRVKEYADHFLSNQSWFTFKFDLETKPNENTPRGRRKEDDYYFYSPDFFYRRVDLDKKTKIDEIMISLILDVVKARSIRSHILMGGLK